MRSFPALLILAAASMLGGCAANHYCLADQKYEHAENRPPLTPVEGLSLPDSATALRIPPPPVATVPFGVRNEAGEGVCLDKPPPMPAPAAAPAAAPSKT
ncbi:MAG: hypothetical protein JWQ90_1393 [Hydrocarboniphaga sp.]|uniref:hypothetical protein n=1 Tax=Hydrocarboniphaga sp. TaxID=2033016 RepID=UPI00262FC381|nr:hypothetical protein [Hydrocarboniphaga sp.]MDB5968943.1 hypothetical protein [Hydrocarboniphaga sp.]